MAGSAYMKKLRISQLGGMRSSLAIFKRQLITPQLDFSYSISSKAFSSTAFYHDVFKSYIFHDNKMLSELTTLFEPRTIAVVGASDRDGAIGKAITNNLILGSKAAGDKLQIFPINPSRKTVLGLECYPSVEAIPEEVDMVVIVTPSSTCLDIMRECGRKGVKSAVVISAGFKEVGPPGVELENKMIRMAREAGIRVVGPNCLGVMNPNAGLNATFAATMGLPGGIAFISQSGAMCTTFLDWSLKEKIGFSAFISVGSMADVGWGDLIDYLGKDTNTKAILAYIESVGDAAAFLGAAKEVGLKKPIVVIKAGRSEAAAAAAASHTGSLAGSHKSFMAAMDRVGVLTTETIRELQDMTLLLGKQPRPLGPNLMIVTNAGGPGVLATDAVVSSGAKLAQLSPVTLEKLNEFLPPAWSHSNPVDILGDAPPHLYAKTLKAVFEDENADGILVILSPQDVTDPTKTAQELIDAVKQITEKEGKMKKPVIAAWMGGNSVSEGASMLSEAGIPTYANSDDAALTFGRLWGQMKAQEELFGDESFNLMPSIKPTASATQSRKLSEKVVHQALSENRYLLTEAESKAILSAYGIGVVRTVLASTLEEVEAAGKELGSELFAVKLNSKTLTHKADVGGVKLNLRKDQLASAYDDIKASVTSMHGLEHFQGVTVQPMLNLDTGLQLIIGSTVDAQFGPLMMFGSGGTMVEVYNDTALAIPPITENMAEKLMQKTKIYKALKGGQGKRFEGINLAQLRSVLVNFSNMIVELSDLIVECDINPLLATKDDLISLDARFTLKTPTTNNSGHVVIRPYPADYVYTISAKSLGDVVVRPILSSDRSSFIEFQRALLPEDVKNCYMIEVPFEDRVNKANLARVCHPDYDKRITLVAEKNGEILAIAELERLSSAPKVSGLFNIIVRHDVHKKGLGKHMLDTVLEVSKREKFESLRCPVRRSNEAARKLLKGFRWRTQQNDSAVDIAETQLV